MKIAYLINQYPQPSHTFIRREIAALEGLGLTVDRYTLRPWGGELADASDREEQRRTRAVLGAGAVAMLAATLAAAVGRPRAFAAALAAALRLGRRSERGTIVHLIYLAEACLLVRWLAAGGVGHLHAHFGTNSAAVAMLCRLLGGPPYSLTVHGPEEFDAPRAMSLGEKVGRSAFTAAVSSFGRSQLCRWADHGDWGKIHVVRCGVDASFLGGGDPGPPPAAPRLVCVGRLAEQKGQLLLLEAAAELRDLGRDFELILVGDGPLRGPIEGLIDRLDLGGHVRLAGVLGGDGVRRAILESRALVLPSFAEGLPVVLMESLALGRPVVSTHVAGIPELVLPGVNGWLVPAGSTGDLVRALDEVLQADVDELHRFGRAGAARVAERHEIRAEATRLARLIAPYPAGVGTDGAGEVGRRPIAAGR